MEENRHKIEDRLTDDYGNILWYKLYVLEEIKEYGHYKKALKNKLKQLPDFTDLLYVSLIIKKMFSDYTESVLEIKIENEMIRKYIEYIDKEIYAFESYTYDPTNYENNTVEIFSKINNDYIEQKSVEFQKEFEYLKSPEAMKLERKLKKAN